MGRGTESGQGLSFLEIEVGKMYLQHYQGGVNFLIPIALPVTSSYYYVISSKLKHTTLPSDFFNIGGTGRYILDSERIWTLAPPVWEVLFG